VSGAPPRPDVQEAARGASPYAYRSGWLRGVVNLLSGLSSSRLVCDARGMSPLSINRDKNHRFSVEIISHAVWLYFRCAPRGAMMS
jgi:hypothetical protein